MTIWLCWHSGAKQAGGNACEPLHLMAHPAQWCMHRHCCKDGCKRLHICRCMICWIKSCTIAGSLRAMHRRHRRWCAARYWAISMRLPNWRWIWMPGAIRVCRNLLTRWSSCRRAQPAMRPMKRVSMRQSTPFASWLCIARKGWKRASSLYSMQTTAHPRVTISASCAIGRRIAMRRRIYLHSAERRNEVAHAITCLTRKSSSSHKKTGTCCTSPRRVQKNCWSLAA